MTLRARLQGPLLWTLSVVTLLALMFGVARLVPEQPYLALLVAVVVLMLGLTLADPTVIPLLAMPVLLVVVRVSAGGIALSVSDVVLFVAFWPAVVLGGRPYTPPMRSLLWLTAVYQACTLFTVVANPFTANAVEWFHAWFLTGGALIIGWALGRAGRGAIALTLLLVASCVIAVATIAQGVAHLPALDPVYPELPFSMHKNFAGTVLCFAALVAYVNPPWMRWPRWLAIAAFALCTGGMLFTQSRQAMVALAVSVAVVVLRTDETRRRSKLLVLGGAGGLALVATVVRDQINSGNQFNSVFQRLTWFQDSLAVWGTDPWFGVGLRWWYTDRFPVSFQPPNAEIEVLTSAGAVGLVLFVVLAVVALRVAWRLDPVYGSVALGVLVNRLTQAQFDLFWSAVQASVPFVVLGICLGAQRYAELRRGAPPAVVEGRVPGVAWVPRVGAP